MKQLQTADKRNLVLNGHEASFEMGTIPQMNVPFCLRESDLDRHTYVGGVTGGGKSKFLELMMRYLMISGRGFTFIDPHGDTSEDLLAYAAHRRVSRGDHDLLKRIHYLEPSFEQIFAYDPFKFRPVKEIPNHLYGNAHTAWLNTKVDRVIEILQRKQGQSGTEGMPRLQRVLRDVLIAVGTTIQRNGPHKGDHLPLADSLVLLDLFHPRHDEVYNLARPGLEGEVRADFERWRAMRNRPDLVFKDTESSINRLRSVLGPLVRSIFCNQTDSIDFHSIIQNDGIILLNLRETDYFSADSAQAIGGLFIHEMLTTAQNTPREDRRTHYLLVDEAGDFVGADIERALGIMRKFKMPITLSSQDLGSFVKGDLDLRPKVLSQCNTRITFKQSWPEDVQILARNLCGGNLDFTKHYQEVDRPDGYVFLPMESYSENFTQNKTWSESETEGFSNAFTTTHSETDSRSNTDSASVNRGRQRSRGKSEGESESNSNSSFSSLSQATGETEVPVIVNGKIVGYTSHVSNNHTGANGGGFNQTTGFNKSKFTGEAESNGWSEGESVTEGTAHQWGGSEMEGESNSYSRGRGHGIAAGRGVTHSLHPLAVHRTEEIETPHLQNSINDQLELFGQMIQTLPQRFAVALLPEATHAVVFRTADVDEKWTEQDKFSIIEGTKQLLYNLHPYFSIPQIGAEAENQRIDSYVAQQQLQPAQVGADDSGML